MTKEQQDRNWACLPDETKKEMQDVYNSPVDIHCQDYDGGFNRALEVYFGHHNLTAISLEHLIHLYELSRN